MTNYRMTVDNESERMYKKAEMNEFNLLKPTGYVMHQQV